MRPDKLIGDGYKYLLRQVRRMIGLYKIKNKPAGRAWLSGLPQTAVISIQKGAGRYSYRGIRMLKNPFEMALYPLLLWQLRPRTVIEIGSNTGASAIWFADILKTYDVDAQIISVDVNLPDMNLQRSNVRFLKGDALNLGDVLTPELLSKVNRPLLVVEDSAHFPETTLKPLEFFDPVLQVGDYIVVEDGNVTDLGLAHKFRGGPGVAIAEFLSRAGDRYELDTVMCDYYGPNFTGNTNGYIKRVR